MSYLQEQAAVAPVPQVATPVAPPSASQMYEAQTAMRRELLRQHDRLTSDRVSIAQRLRNGDNVTGADRAGLEARLQELDGRILEMEKQIAQADAAVAQAAGVPGAVVTPPRPINNGPPEEVFVLGAVFLMVVAFPIALAYARRIWRRGSETISPKVTAEITDRMSRLEQAIDTVAVEVERIGEGQRFVTNLFIESGAPLALGAGAMQPLEARQQTGAPVESHRPAR
jgi:hypothetical protein